MIDDKILISRLMASAHIGQEVLRQGLDLAEKQGNTLYETLIFSELVDEFIVVNAASQILNVPCVHLADTTIDVQTAQIITREMAISTQSIPVEVIDDGGVEVLKLAMSDPIDVMAMDEVASHTGIDIQPVLAGPAAIETAIEKLYGLDGDQEVVELDEVVDEPAFELEEEVVELEEIDDEDIVAFEDGSDGEESYELDYGTVDFGADDFGGSGDEFDLEDEEAIGFDDDFEDESELDDEFDFSADDDEVDFDDELTPGSDEHLIEEAVDDELALADASEGLAKDEDSWALMFDEAEETAQAQSAESGMEAFSPPPQTQESEASKTQIGSPAQIGRWGEDDLLVESEAHEEEELDEADEEENPGLEETSWELEEIGDGGVEKKKEKAATSASSSEDQEKEERQKDKKRLVPSSIRDMLEDKKSKKGTGAGDKPETNEKKGLRLPRPKKKAQKKEEVEKKIVSDDSGTVQTEEEADDGASTLGRIAVKKVAVPTSTFKGAIEKRSDRKKTPSSESRSSRSGTGNVAPPPVESRTREMSLGELADLTGKKGQNVDQAAVKIPDGVDGDRLLRGLISLLVDRELVSAEDIQALVENIE